jgi:hypothetical protein
MTQHTPECLARFDRICADYAAWVAKWPAYCRTCEGYGGKWDRSDEDGPAMELCPDCTEQNRCPRCGTLGLHGEDADGPCDGCGWIESDLPPLDPTEFTCDGECNPVCRYCDGAGSYLFHTDLYGGLDYPVTCDMCGGSGWRDHEPPEIGHSQTLADVGMSIFDFIDRPRYLSDW